MLSTNSYVKNHYLFGLKVMENETLGYENLDFKALVIYLD
jgi:hypothetical protein